MTDKELDNWAENMKAYIRDFIDYKAIEIKERVNYLYYFKVMGISLIYEKRSGFPSFSHWKFNGYRPSKYNDSPGVKHNPDILYGNSNQGWNYLNRLR